MFHIPTVSVSLTRVPQALRSPVRAHLGLCRNFGVRGGHALQEEGEPTGEKEPAESAELSGPAPSEAAPNHAVAPWLRTNPRNNRGGSTPTPLEAALTEK